MVWCAVCRLPPTAKADGLPPCYRCEDPADYPSIQHKIEKAVEVTKRGLEEYDTPAVMWTGGKDSTLTLYFIN